MMTDPESRSGDIHELVEAWQQHVDKIDAERDLSGTDPSVWGAHDLPAALYLRDRVQRALEDSNLAVQDRNQLSAEVSRVDQRFQTATVEDTDHLLGRLLSEDVSGRSWWWHRVPTSGPIVEELRRLFG